MSLFPRCSRCDWWYPEELSEGAAIAQKPWLLVCSSSAPGTRVASECTQAWVCSRFLCVCSYVLPHKQVMCTHQTLPFIRFLFPFALSIWLFPFWFSSLSPCPYKSKLHSFLLSICIAISCINRIEFYIPHSWNTLEFPIQRLNYIAFLCRWSLVSSAVASVAFNKKRLPNIRGPSGLRMFILVVSPTPYPPENNMRNNLPHTSYKTMQCLCSVMFFSGNW